MDWLKWSARQMHFSGSDGLAMLHLQCSLQDHRPRPLQGHCIFRLRKNTRSCDSHRQLSSKRMSLNRVLGPKVIKAKVFVYFHHHNA